MYEVFKVMWYWLDIGRNFKKKFLENLMLVQICIRIIMIFRYCLNNMIRKMYVRFCILEIIVYLFVYIINI